MVVATFRLRKERKAIVSKRRLKPATTYKDKMDNTWKIKERLNETDKNFNH